MRLRVLLLLVVGILCASGISYKPSTKAQSSGSAVWLGDAKVTVSPVALTGTTEIKVAVGTGAEVPRTGVDPNAAIRAIVQVAENSNFGGVNYGVTPPSREIRVPLAGGGNSSVGTFTIEMDSGNTKSGEISFRVALVRLENNPPAVQMANPLSKDVSLSVTKQEPSPTPTPTPPLTVESCHMQGWFWNYWENTCTQHPTCQLMPEPCEPGYRWDFEWCQCMPNYGSPVLIDVAGDGFRLTDLAGGVRFDLNGDVLLRERVAWTAPDSDDAFLFLDRNEDRIVNSGVELFGDMTPQPYSPTPNGFVALSLYDTDLNGGNGDGIIDGFDAAYSQLRLWQDRNHNGVSEPGELHTLESMGVASISLDFKESKQQDQFGNLFRFRARVEPVRRAEAGKWAWDVFLLSQ
jgi:hypothetical protein